MMMGWSEDGVLAIWALPPLLLLPLLLVCAKKRKKKEAWSTPEPESRSGGTSTSSTPIKRPMTPVPGDDPSYDTLGPFDNDLSGVEKPESRTAAYGRPAGVESARTEFFPSTRKEEGTEVEAYTVAMPLAEPHPSPKPLTKSNPSPMPLEESTWRLDDPVPIDLEKEDVSNTISESEQVSNDDAEEEEENGGCFQELKTMKECSARESSCKDKAPPPTQNPTPKARQPQLPIVKKPSNKSQPTPKAKKEEGESTSLSTSGRGTSGKYKEESHVIEETMTKDTSIPELDSTLLCDDH